MNQQISKIAPKKENQITFPTAVEWNQILDIGTRAYRSGMLPSSIKSAEAAAIIALKAWELGLPPMMAFSHIHVINGKPTLSAELMQALAKKNIPGLLINILESTDKIATVEIRRPERGELPFKMSFSIIDAERAKLLAKDVWKQYPKAMLWSRAVSAALRAKCPDALMGVSYTPEELGAEVAPDGTAIETTSRPVTEEEKTESIKNETTTEINERGKLITEMVGLVSQKAIPKEKIAEHLQKQYQAASSKELKNEEMKHFIQWIAAWNAEPEEVEIKSAPIADYDPNFDKE